MREVVFNNVFELRSKFELTQENLATRVGISRQTVVAIERGNYVPSILLALKLAGVFKLPVEKIFCIKYEK